MIPTIEALESVHSFPGPFTFKLIGPNTDTFRAAVHAITDDVAGSLGAARFSERTSSADHHLAITVDVNAQNAHHVQALYEAYRKIEGLRLLL